MIDVLWVDDHCYDEHGEPTQLCNSIYDTAYECGIHITAYNTYEDAISELERHPLKWTAIILDICNERAVGGGLADGFSSAYDQIKDIRKRKNRKEPYIFVFSGSDEYANYCIKMGRKADFAGAQEIVYSKPSGAEKLFDDIKKIPIESGSYQTREKFKDIFEAAQNELMKFNENDKERLLKIACEIDYKQENREDGLFNDMRKIGEKIARFIPKQDEKAPSNSLNAASGYIGRNDYVPTYIQRSFHSLSKVLNEGCHDIGQKGSTQTIESVRSGKAPYLLRSCMYELFNIIIWLSNKLEEYGSIDAFQKKLRENEKIKQNDNKETKHNQ